MVLCKSLSAKDIENNHKLLTNCFPSRTRFERIEKLDLNQVNDKYTLSLHIQNVEVMANASIHVPIDNHRPVKQRKINFDFDFLSENNVQVRHEMMNNTDVSN